VPLKGAVPILDNDETEILRKTRVYFYLAMAREKNGEKEHGQSVLLRYYAGKALSPVREREKSKRI
jgi:hypothetical protein